MIATATAVTTAFAGNARAFPDNVDELPFGHRLGCDVCHPSSTDYTLVTAFGEQTNETYLAGDVVDWSALYSLDADHDCFSNGEELGDPTGGWVTGSADPSGEPTDPNDPTDIPQLDLDGGGGAGDAGDSLNGDAVPTLCIDEDGGPRGDVPGDSSTASIVDDSLPTTSGGGDTDTVASPGANTEDPSFMGPVGCNSHQAGSWATLSVVFLAFAIGRRRENRLVVKVNAWKTLPTGTQPTNGERWQ